MLALSLSALAMAAPLKVTVCGGSGFVGSRVCKYLVDAGAEVTSVSLSGKPPAAFAGEDWTKEVTWKATNIVRGPRETLEACIGTPDAIVSCQGSIGFDRQGLLLGNGIANKDIAAAAKKAGVKKIAYVSVSKEVEDAKGFLPGFFEGYFEGKTMATEAYLDAVGADGLAVVKPTFIYGGDEFAIAPPRVTADYGEGVANLLASAPFKFLADAMPSSIALFALVKVALRPPVSVDAVAAACAKAALGDVAAGQYDGTESIDAAADLPPKVEAGAAAL